MLGLYLRKRITLPGAAMSHEPLRALFDQLPSVQCWIKDRQHRYVWVNRAFLLNYSLEELAQVAGKTDFDLSPPHLADQYQTDDARVLKGEKIRGRIELVGRFDHTSIWSLTDKIPVTDARGKITGSAGMTRPLGKEELDRDIQHAALGRVIAMIRQNCAEAWTNPRLASAANMSVRAFERHFRAHYRITPQNFVRALRIRLACHALVYSTRTLSDIARSHGFTTQSHFTREFRKITQLTPKAYREKFM
jgi:AraC-like DNA-binding protein